LPEGNGVLPILFRRRAGCHESEGFSGEGAQARIPTRENPQCPPQKQDLEVSASDWLALDETPIRGNTVCLYLSGGTREELRTLFERLSEGAEVTNPLKEQFFGMYGALNDKFGVRWMFHSNKKA
jgi:uncharacterized glyoxalase superfamily protein PhnB